ncbi:hypothetical protein RyT2_03400 [Pseudolactococcus yaeyamensis]
MTEEVKVPTLAVWKMSVGASVVGFILNRIMIKLTIFHWQINLIVSIVFSIIYALWIFPSLFSDKPVFRVSKVISFLNFGFGILA